MLKFEYVIGNIVIDYPLYTVSVIEIDRLGAYRHTTTKLTDAKQKAKKPSDWIVYKEHAQDILHKAVRPYLNCEVAYYEISTINNYIEIAVFKEV